MQDVCELNYKVEQDVQAVEPISDEPPGDDQSPSRPMRVIASVGAWLVERFANVPGAVFIEDGRLAVYSRELQTPKATTDTTKKVLH